ncbi:MAG: hypothetical protein DRP87_13555 [Spirochaetes bacterium]|nr:MAG: hypothetical protein DRP87_13555 [Spirochaetota bacterium]
MEGLKSYLLLVIGFIFIFLFFACESRKEKDKEKSAVSKEESQAEKPGSSDEQSGLRPERTLAIGLTKESKEEEEKTPDIILTEKERLLEFGGGKKIFPEDFKIGPLQDRFTASAEERAILKVLESFLESLLSGEVHEESISPEWRGAIARSLKYYLERGQIPKSYRIGEINTADSIIRINVRLFGEVGRSSGEVYFEKDGKKWYISDVTLNLALLDKEYRQEEDFEPEVYRWLDTKIY